MNIQEAAQLATAMERKLKAFQRIGEVLREAANAESVVAGHQNRLTEVQSEIENAQKELTALGVQITEAEGELAQQLEQNRTALAEQLAEQQKQLQERTVFFQHQLREAEQEHMKEAQALEAFRGVSERERAGLQDEIDSLTGARDEIKEQLRQLAS